MGEENISRRALVGAAVSAAVVGTVRVAASKERAVEETAQALADAMREIHGGDWRFDVDHDIQMVMVIPA